jgi:DNA sulfur modification protein DndD
MIIEQLVLHDFGIYQGRHEINLRPDDESKPIILIGARNGRGKTTMLDAINLVLFGQRARLSNRKNSPWEKYLRESINRRAAGSALVGMRFSLEDDLETRIYEITRSWEISGRSVKEFFDVSINGERDRVLADDWDEHIEALLPLEVASLNFFDGEKIDQLADPAESRNVIRAAIRGLLGLGVLEKLEADLKVLLRRKQDEAIGEQASSELVGLERELEALQSRRADVRQEMAQIRTLVERNGEVLRRIEEQAKSLGADKWEQRAAMELEARQLQLTRGTLESELHAIGEGPAPLALVRNLLTRTRDQMKADEDVQLASVMLSELMARDSRILKSIDGSVSKALEPVFTKDRQSYAERAGQPTVHQASGQTRSLIEAALRDVQPSREIPMILQRLDDVDSQITDNDRLLMSVPTEGQLGPVLEELGRTRAQSDVLAQQLEALESEEAHLTSAIERHTSLLERERDAEADRHKVGMDDQRIREYAQRALQSVGQLSQATIGRNLATIETAILTRFHELIGKKNLITDVRIDRTDLELRVITSDGEQLPIERLSAGERQLLATATLWGLATVAGRSIPLVIDTPLGRLDGDHRENLATNYFPFAARQVVILSTDSEFDSDLYSKVRPAISREYLIQFREENESSEIVPGYFTEVADVH